MHTHAEDMYAQTAPLMHLLSNEELWPAEDHHHGRCLYELRPGSLLIVAQPIMVSCECMPHARLMNLPFLDFPLGPYPALPRICKHHYGPHQTSAFSPKPCAPHLESWLHQPLHHHQRRPNGDS